MTQKIHIVDAFTDRPFAGNPAAVCLLQRAAEPHWMQQVAAELNLSETAFLVPRTDDGWDLRWFTPKVEVDLCGHATLASAHVLWREYGVAAEVLRFHTRSGWLAARRSGEFICLDFPADPAVPCDPPDDLAAALGVVPVEVHRGAAKLLAVVSDAATVRELRPDAVRLAALDAQGVIVTAPGDRPDLDFVSRFFAPRVGVPEDPVTGSAHCTLGPYWAQRLHKTSLRAFQASARGGEVGVTVRDERVELRGRAVTTLTGDLHA